MCVQRVTTYVRVSIKTVHNNQSPWFLIIIVIHLRIDTGGCSVIRATPVLYDIAHLHSSINI